MTQLDDQLYQQLERGRGPDDQDWQEVLARASLETYSRRRLRVRTAALIAAVLGVLALSPAIGLGSQLVDWVDGVESADREFRESHNDDVLPRHLFVREIGANGIIDGRVRSDAIVALEIRFADGGKETFKPGERGSFRYRVPAGRQPQALNARGADGSLVESVPLPPSPSAATP